MKQAVPMILISCMTVVALAQTTAPPPPVPAGVERSNPTAQPPGGTTAIPVAPAPAPGSVPIIPPGNLPAPRRSTPQLDANGEANRPPARSGHSGPATKLTLQEALSRALQLNNNVERSRAEISLAEANKSYLFSQVLPRIVTTGSLIRNSTEVQFGSGVDARTVLPRNDWNYRIILSQPVYAGNRERRAYSQADLAVGNARQAARGTEDQVLLRIASNYLAAVDADARIGLERRNIEQATRRRTQATAFYQAGESTKVDVLRAETAIKSSQRMLALAQQNREAAVSQLRVDLDLDSPIDVARPEHPMPEMPDEAALEARAASRRADVAVAQNNLSIASLEVRKQRGFWYPTVTFDGGRVTQKATFPTHSYSYGALRFNIPLLQSGEVEARVAGARAREIEARLDLESARLNAREDVRRALSDLHSAETGFNLAREQLVAAEAEYDQSFELYRAQESTSLDLSEAENSLASARRAVAEETLNRDLSELRVWYAAGSLKEAVAAAAAP